MPRGPPKKDKEGVIADDTVSTMVVGRQDITTPRSTSTSSIPGDDDIYLGQASNLRGCDPPIHQNPSSLQQGMPSSPKCLRAAFLFLKRRLFPTKKSAETDGHDSEIQRHMPVAALPPPTKPSRASEPLYGYMAHRTGAKDSADTEV